MEMTQKYLGTLTNWSGIVKETASSGRYRHEEKEL